MMLSNLFKPKIVKNKCYHFIIGYQNLIVIELLNKNAIIIDKVIEKLVLTFDNIYWFHSFTEMEKELDLLITNTKENYLVIIN